MATKTTAKTAKSSAKSKADAKAMLGAKSAIKKGPAPKKLTPAERAKQAAKKQAKQPKVPAGAKCGGVGKAPKKGELTGTMSTADWVFKFEKSTKTTHVYSRVVASGDAYRTAKQYLSVVDYPKAPKSIIVKVGVPKAK